MTDTPAGFVRSLFAGRLAGEALLPFPRPAPEVAELTRDVVEAVEAWAEATVDPAAVDRAAALPPEVLDGLAELGLFGLTLPEEHGGAACTQHTYARVMQALAHRCPSTSTVLGGHLGLGSKFLLLHGTDAQRTKWLPRLAAGELKACFALTEHQAGSDAGALRTVADRLEDGSWRIRGTKAWITNGGFADFFAVFARTPHPERPDAPVHERPISAFAVTTDELGGGAIQRGVEEDKMGLKGSSTVELAFEDVVVPAENLIGPEGGGFKVALEVLNSGRHSLAACCIGQTRLARDVAVAHAREREQFGRPIGRFGMVQELLAAMEADLYAMEACTDLAAGLVDRGAPDFMLEASCCKLFATERLWVLSNFALQIAGGTGFIHEYPYERIVRDARINLIFEGTNQVLRMMVALQGLGHLRRSGASDDPGDLAGVHPALAAERAELEAIAPELGRRAAALLAARADDLREAQHDQRRLTNLATALFVATCVLSRASDELEAGAEDGALAVVRLAFRRQVREARAALAEGDEPHDAMVGAVAERMLG